MRAATRVLLYARTCARTWGAGAPHLRPHLWSPTAPVPTPAGFS